MFNRRYLLAGLFLGVLALDGIVIGHILSAQGKVTTIESGVPTGEMLTAFTPVHVTGSDKSTNACPICKYPLNPAVQVWVNTDDEKNLTPLVAALEKASAANAAKKFKAFVVFINPDKRSQGQMTRRLENLVRDSNVKNVALTFLSDPQDEAVHSYQINTDARVKNTLFVYRNRTVATKFVNFTADKNGLEALNAAIRKVL